MKRSKIRKPLLSLLVFAAVIALGVGFHLRPEPQAQGIEYRTVAVTRSDIHVQVLSTGTVQPQNRLEIKPPVAGRIEQISIQEGTIVQPGQILATMSSTERAAMLDAARAQGDAEVRKWSDYYRPTPIIAPIEGMLILRNIEPGQTVTTQDPILVLSDRLIVQAQVDETDIARIAKDQPAVITLDAYSDRPLPARVSKIAYEATTVNNVTTYLVDVLPDHTPEYMRSGMTANISFSVNERKGVLTVPAYAINMKEEGPTVLVGNPARPEERTEVPVEIGISDGERTEIISGLKENDHVLAPALGAKREGASSPFSPMRGGRRR